MFNLKKRNKPKHQEGYDVNQLDIMAPPCANAMCNLQYVTQTQHYQQHQFCLNQMPPCQIHPCQTQHLVQSPHQQQYHYMVPNQYKNNSLESRLVDTNSLAMNNQIHSASNLMPTLAPAYQANNQMQVINNQQYSENTHYSNQPLIAMMPEQQQHHNQQHLNQENQFLAQQPVYQQYQQQPQQQQPQTQQQQQQQYSNQLDDARQRQQLLEQQQLQQQFQNHSINDDLRKEQYQLQHQQSQQQYYQNQQVVDELTTDLSLDVLYKLHERDMEDLTKLASDIKNDIKNLTDELNVIQKETPSYKVVHEFKL